MHSSDRSGREEGRPSPLHMSSPRMTIQAMTTDSAETPQIIKVADGFYVRQAVDNMAWIDMGDHAIVVDALEQRHLEGEVMDAIEQTFGGKPVRFVLNTHTHYDHVALNDAFHHRFGAEIINQQTCRIGPDGRWFDGKRRLQMLATPGCHTSEDCCVWCPQTRCSSWATSSAGG